MKEGVKVKEGERGGIGLGKDRGKGEGEWEEGSEGGGGGRKSGGREGLKSLLSFPSTPIFSLFPLPLQSLSIHLLQGGREGGRNRSIYIIST